MKKLFIILSIFLIPFVVFGDVLPEPDIFYTNQDENTLDTEDTTNQDENILDTEGTTIQEQDTINPYTNEITIDNS
jgi:hypothetical protein